MVVGVTELQTPQEISVRHLLHLSYTQIHTYTNSSLYTHAWYLTKCQTHRFLVRLYLNELDNEFNRCFIVIKNVFAQWEQLFLHLQIPPYPDDAISH